MPLDTGTALNNRYRIVSLLGHGGGGRPSTNNANNGTRIHEFCSPGAILAGTNSRVWELAVGC